MKSFDREEETRRLSRGFFLVLGFMVVEVVTGFLAGSLALISDGAHMATDALGVGMALAAFVVTRRPRGGTHTFGLYRLEILAALANAVILLGVGVFVIVEGWQRLQEPTPIEIGPVLAVASVGLLVNVVTLRWLRGHSLNLRAARNEIVADLISSVGVIVGSLVVALTGWREADPVVAMLVGAFVVPRAWSIGRQAVRILVQAAPEHIDVDQVRSDLLSVTGVSDLHDLHLWTLTSGMEVASAHLLVDQEADSHEVLDRARSILEDGHGIAHATLQVESQAHRSCVEVEW